MRRSGAVREVQRNPASVTFPALGLLVGGDLYVWCPGFTHRDFIAASGQDGLRVWLHADVIRIDFNAFLIVDEPGEAEELLRTSGALRAIYPGGFGIRWLVDGGGG